MFLNYFVPTGKIMALSSTLLPTRETAQVEDHRAHRPDLAVADLRFRVVLHGDCCILLGQFAVVVLGDLAQRAGQVLRLTLSIIRSPRPSSRSFANAASLFSFLML